MPKDFIKISKIKKYKKVRLKFVISDQFVCVLCLLFVFLIDFVKCNRPPRFLIEGQSEIVLRLKEGSETPVGTLIYKLRGFDPDNDPLTFGVRNAPESEIIKVENSGKNEANVYLAQELDRETKDEYSIVLTLTDNHFGSSNQVNQSLLLLVEDINDNEPIFKPYQSALEVPENSRPGIITELEATDRDEGAYGQVVYYLQELDGDNDIFSVTTSQGKGIIRLIGKLDYERKSLYQLRVLAIDRANQGPINTGTAAILVKVKDIEDQPPEFVQVQSVTRIPEDAKPGTQVLHVKAIDGDRGVNNKIKYSMENIQNALFSIEEDTGIVYTTRNLDREDTRNQVNGAYIVKILAIEVSNISPPPYVRTEVTIIITDVNDETPTFRENLYRCEVNENAQINTPLTFTSDVQNEVFDYDLGQNGTFELFIDPPNDVFEITPSLAVNEANFLIRVKDPIMLDFEQVSQMNFTIVAKEIAFPRKWSTANVQVIIKDQNDNFPEFTQPVYDVTIPENCEVGTTIFQVQAYDIDSGDFGTLGMQYTDLRGSIAQLLHLDPVTGVLTVKLPGGSAFDREVISRHYLTIEARDNSGLGNRNTAQLIINIEDVNDNAPTFLQGRYEANLLENNLNFETNLILEARDSDLNGTDNSKVSYEIFDGQLKNNFTINSKTGVMKPRTYIDFEELVGDGMSNIRPIELSVYARDSGVPSLASKVQVIIYVQDVNDNAPIFEKTFYSKMIPEDLPGGSDVLEVKAFDKDGSASNNRVVYRIQKGASDKFVISPDTGFISIAQGASLDPDLSSPKKLFYTLTVMAFDNGLGDKQLTASTLVNITIKDVNNKPPVFMEAGTIRIRENTPVGTNVHRVMATDLDEMSILRYRLDASSSEARTEEGAFVKITEYDYISAFEINPLDGILKVVKLLDREKIEQVKLGVMVQDMASMNNPQIATSALNIIIEDENDNNPKFKKPFYKKSITENSMNGVVITSVVAFDVDKNKTISYSLEGDPNILDLVHLDSETGEIVAANKIDHESYQWLNFTVRATDSGFPPRSSLVDIFISVLDENDNNPYFLTGTKNFSISENSPIGSRVGTIQATDADSGDFGKITFLMDRISSQGKFSIDADTGVLSVADKLDREVKDFYMLVVEAWDNYQFGFLAGESRNAFKQIFVHILDENDSPPEINVPSECVDITEYHNLKDLITTIKGKDADDRTSPNGRLEFSIVDGNNDGLFQLTQIDPWTMQIYARDSLKNKYGNYSLLISARDLGTPSNIVKKSLDICISDFNDHPPIFVSPSHNVTVRVPENTTVGATILQVHATDDDIGPNALVKYRLKPDSLGSYKTFSIEEDSGKIFLKQELDREKQKIYEIRIEAYDQGIPTSLSSDLDLTIYIRNVNDYEPQFLVDEISVNFTEHMKPGEEKIKLPDTIDRDEVDELDDPPSAVCYYIVHGNEKEIFELDPNNHILTIKQELDREVQATHTLFVRATENCDVPQRNITLEQPQALISPRMDIQSMKPAVFYRRTGNGGRYQTQYDRYMHSRNLRSISEDLNKNHSFVNEGILLEDSTIVRIIIYVQDVNDNPPKFVTKIFTGGITTQADFGTKFMYVKAIDPDYGPNAIITYYQISEIRRTLSEGLENVLKSPFLVDRETGAIQLNFDPQKGMKGYFDFMVLANDTGGLKDIAHVFIYLLREDQKVRFVFRQQPPVLREKISIFRDTLSNVTDAIVNIDEFKVHENKDGSVDRTKTDLYLHLVHKKDNSIFEVSDVLKLIDEHIEKLDELFKEFNVLDTQAAEPQLLIGDIGKRPMLIWLVFSNIFIATLLVLTLALCASQRTNYKRQLRAARVNIFGNQPTPDIQSRDPVTRVPNTNKHSVEGSNPMWLKAYENEWFKNDEDLSQDGTDSLDENVLTADQQSYKPTRLFDKQNDLNRHFNVYQQIDKLTSNAEILAKKLETTEL